MQYEINLSVQLSFKKIMSMISNPNLNDDDVFLLKKMKEQRTNTKNDIFTFKDNYKKIEYGVHNYGRLYGAIIPRLKNSIRAELLSEKYSDIDAKNCNQSLVKDLCITNGIDCPLLDEYIADRKKYFEKIDIVNPDKVLSDYNIKNNENCDINSFKKHIFTDMFGGKSIENIIIDYFNSTTTQLFHHIRNDQHVTNIKDEYDSIRKTILKCDTYRDMFNHIQNANNTQKSDLGLFTILLNDTEADLVLSAIKTATDKGIKVIAYIYDGFIIQNIDDKSKEDKFLSEINSNGILTFVKKDWQRKLSDIPIIPVKEIILSDIQKEIQVNIIQSNTMSIAKCLHNFFRKNYKTTKQLNKDAIIYRFTGHYWNNVTPSEFRTVYSNELLIHINEYLNTDSENKEFQKIHKLVNSTVSINQILFEVIVLLNDEKFESIRDSNINLVAFKNGILSLPDKEFRNGKKEDKITNCISHNYTPGLYPTEFIDMLSKIIPDEQERNFLLKSVSKCFKGKNLHQRVYIFNGKGSNGKSLLMEIFKRVFDIYFRSSPAQLLTDDTDVADKATPTICKMKGKRFLAFMEPSKKKLNQSMIKKLSGETTIESRNLFSDSVDQRIEFTMFISANEISYDCDYSMLRRLLQINFNSTFDEKIISDDPINHTYVLDNTLIEKSMAWTESIISFLIDIYDETDSEIPDTILAYNLEQNALKQTDIQQFLSETYRYDQNKYPIVYTTIKSIQDQLTVWKMNNSVTKVYKKNEVKQAVLDQWKNTKLTPNGFNNLIMINSENPQSAESEFPESEPISNNCLLG
jgi:phage/plasmid-associated DNA primase